MASMDMDIKKYKKKQVADYIGLPVSEFDWITSGIPIIRSKFYTGIFFPDFDKMSIRKAIEYKRNEAERCLRERDFAGYVWRHERPFRLQAFLEIQNDMLNEVGIWDAGSLVGDIWVDAEFLGFNVEVWRELFSYYGANLMDKDEVHYFVNLPDRFRVYHGDEGVGDAWLSWTLDKGVAQFFAKRFVDDARRVTSKMVNKSDCLCYFGRRNEKEIIIL